MKNYKHINLLFSVLIIIFGHKVIIGQNSGLDFDGTNDYIQTTYSGITGASARTVEAWIKTTANTVGNQNVIADWGDMALGHRFTPQIRKSH